MVLSGVSADSVVDEASLDGTSAPSDVTGPTVLVGCCGLSVVTTPFVLDGTSTPSVVTGPEVLEGTSAPSVVDCGEGGGGGTYSLL